MFLLFIIQVFIGVCLGFQHLTKKYLFKKTLLFKTTTTCYPDEDDDKEYNYRKNINKYTNILLENAESEYDFELLDNHDNKPLYTLIWFNCEECDEIKAQMKALNLKYIFINMNINTFILKEDYDIFPLLYKEEDCIGDNLFDIYKELYV